MMLICCEMSRKQTPQKYLILNLLELVGFPIKRTKFASEEYRLTLGG